MGPTGAQVATYPGAAFLAEIVGYASKHGRRPSEVYDDYLAHPQDYRLVFAWERVLGEEQEKAIEAEKEKAKTKGRARR